MSDSLDFYFDFSSPYGYLAAERIDGIAAKHGRTATWRPMLLGAVFQKIGGSPLVDQPMKGPYSRHDMLRSARLHGIAFNVPDNFPVNSIAACRAYYWLAESDAGTAHDLALALYRGYFVDNRDLSQPETVVAGRTGARRRRRRAGGGGAGSGDQGPLARRERCGDRARRLRLTHGFRRRRDVLGPRPA